MSSTEHTDQSEEMPGGGRGTGGRSPHPAYELFVLGELMDGPQYGYKLHAIIQRILGPFHRLSWGTLYPLIRRLERQGLLTSETIQAAPPQEERGQPRKLYHLTAAGQARFFALMLDPGEYNRDYPDVFAVKLSKFSLLTPTQRLTVLQQYHEYLQTLRNHYANGRHTLEVNPRLNEQERPFLLQLADYHIQTLDAQLNWLADMIASIEGRQ